MPEFDVPPLKREALDQIPTVQQDLLTYWAGMQQISAQLLPALEAFDPDRIQAGRVAQWVEANRKLLQSYVDPLIRLSHRLSTLQERPPDPEWLAFLVEEIEDEAAPTD
jgi:hypothetical protein